MRRVHRRRALAQLLQSVDPVPGMHLVFSLAQLTRESIDHAFYLTLRTACETGV